MAADPTPNFEVGLFDTSPEGGVRLVGLTRDPDLVERVRGALLAHRRGEFDRLRRRRLRPVRRVQLDDPNPA